MPSEQHEQIAKLLRDRPIADGLADIETARKGMEQMTAMTPLPEGAVCEPVTADGVPCEWIRGASARDDGTFLYLHGGGYSLGSIATHRALVARLSEASGLRALSVDYRLAPEHPFPAGLEDAKTAYRWLLAQGVDPARLVIGGDSAGGGLTIATLVALRDEGARLPAASVCLSPWTDLEGTGESARTKADADPMIDAQGLAQMGRLYVGEDGDLRHPLAAPLYADLAGLPPLLVQVGTAEVLLDDSTRLAERGRAAGVDIELEAFDDLMHVFQAFAPIVPEAVEAIDKIGAFVRRRV